MSINLPTVLVVRKIDSAHYHVSDPVHRSKCRMTFSALNAKSRYRELRYDVFPSVSYKNSKTSRPTRVPRFFQRYFRFVCVFFKYFCSLISPRNFLSHTEKSPHHTIPQDECGARSSFAAARGDDNDSRPFPGTAAPRFGVATLTSSTAFAGRHRQIKCVTSRKRLNPTPIDVPYGHNTRTRAGG